MISEKPINRSNFIDSWFLSVGCVLSPFDHENVSRAINRLVAQEPIMTYVIYEGGSFYDRRSKGNKEAEKRDY